jgi:CBS domain-containing protein
MLQWRVRDVMTTQVITAPDDASAAEVAAMLTGHRISAVPIVDRFGAVVGVVSWTDLRNTIDIAELGDNGRASWWRRWTSPLLRSPHGAARQVMSAPPVTITPEASLPAAGRMMYRRSVGRLLVVDGNGRLLGLVTRSDLLKVHARLDAVIRDEVTQRVLRRTLAIGPGAVQATVDDGVVTLIGHTARRTTALAAARLSEAVAGVTGVVDRLTFDIDDTAPEAATAHPADPDPVHGRLIGRQPARPVTRAAGHRPPSHDDQQVTRTAALP